MSRSAPHPVWRKTPTGGRKMARMIRGISLCQRERHGQLTAATGADAGEAAGSNWPAADGGETVGAYPAVTAMATVAFSTGRRRLSGE